jgi:hypothetical protein
MMRYRALLILSFLLAFSLPQAAFAEDSAAPESSSFITDFQWVTYGSGITQITTGLQFSHARWYTELTMGGFSAYDNREAAFFIGLNFGHRFPVNSWLFLAADLGGRKVMPSGSDDPTINTGKFLTLDGCLRLEAVLGKHMSVFIGAATTNVYQDNSFNTVDTREGSIFWGVGLL